MTLNHEIETTALPLHSCCLNISLLQRNETLHAVYTKNIMIYNGYDICTFVPSLCITLAWNTYTASW